MLMTVWDTHKCFIRGELNTTTKHKKIAQAKIGKLMAEITHLESAHKATGANDTLEQLTQTSKALLD